MKAFALFNFADGPRAPNRGLRAPGGGWTDSGGTTTTIGTAEGRMAVNGSGGISFGPSRVFDGFSPASSPCWFATVIKHGAYVNRGSGYNQIFGYGSISSANGFWLAVNSSNQLIACAANRQLTGPTLVTGRTYRVAFGRNAGGSCWLWVNGKLSEARDLATTADSAGAYVLYALTDETIQRYYAGGIGMLAFGSDDPTGFGAALSKNPWQLFPSRRLHTYSVPYQAPVEPEPPVTSVWIGSAKTVRYQHMLVR